jgi:hypothetical protein
MIPLILLDITITSEYPLDLGANPGASIRGALYETLAAMYDTGDAATSRHDWETNPVAWLLRLEDRETSGGQDVPRPLAIRPPLQAGTTELKIGLAVYGHAVALIPMLLSAWVAMQEIGMGRNRRKFHLHTLEAVDPLTRQTTLLLDAAGKQVAALPPAPSRSAYERFAQLLHPAQLEVQFLTPTRIIQGGALVHRPDFRPLVQRLLERIRQISELYTPEPLWLPFRDLLPLLDQVQVTADHTRWVERWSHSRLDGTSKPTSGFEGVVYYQGDLAPLLPYLLLGQALQVGKNTIKGCGWYTLVYRWQ